MQVYNKVGTDMKNVYAPRRFCEIEKGKLFAFFASQLELYQFLITLKPIRIPLTVTERNVFDFTTHTHPGKVLFHSTSCNFTHFGRVRHLPQVLIPRK